MSGPIRDDSVYLPWQTRKALGYLVTEECTTVDAIADKILNDYLMEKAPEVVKHIQDQHEIDKAFRARMKQVKK